MSSETYEEEYDASPLVDNIMEEAEDDMRKEHQAHEREQQRQGMLLSGDTLTLDIEEQEKYVMEGVRMFLSNDFDGAERHCMAGFENHGDPICMIVVTCIAVVRALCTFRHEDIELVKEYSLKAYYAADALLPKESVGSKLVRFVTRRTREQLSMIQLRAIVAKSEASSLRALALLLGESVVGLIKASMAARLSYNLLTSLDAHPQRASMVPAVSEGVSLGLGLNNLLLSALPPRLLKLVSFFGFPHDRKKGEELILQVIDGCGNRSPTAYMIALILYGVLPSFASVLVEPCLPKALALCKKYLDGYPESVLLTWLIGRVYRMQRDVKKSTQFFEKSIESVKDRGPFTVLGNFAWYDKAWSHCCMFEWEAAIACFETLLDKSSWSPAFYTFAAGACFEALGRWDEALARYRLAPSLINRRIMGRTISVEQYIQDRVKELTPAQSAPSVVDTSTDSEASQGCCMPIWELMYLFALFGQVPHDKLKDMVSTLETYIEGSSTLKSTWKIHTPITELLLSRANFEIQNVSVAQKHLENVLESVDGVAQQQDESYPGWVLPHALYEATSQGHLRGDAESGSQYAKKLNGYLQQKKDFNFEFMLQLRCHLSVDSFNTEIS